VAGNRVVFRGGIPVAAVEAGETRILSALEPGDRAELERILDERPPSAFDPARAAMPRTRGPS